MGNLWSGRLGVPTSLGSSFQQLKLAEDDPAVDDLGDGISATRLIPDAHLVLGLVKIDGYSVLSRFITDKFEVIRGSTNDNKPANFFEFPYDWRRDNRVSARQLKRPIDQCLRKNVSLCRAPVLHRRGQQGRPPVHEPGLHPGAKRPEGRADEDTTLMVERRQVRVRRWN